MNTTGERITRIREHLRYSQRKFAEQIGKTGSHLSKIEKGEAPALEGTIDSIVLKFNVNRDWLMTGEGEMFNQEVKADNSNPPAWAKELLHKIDKLIELQIANNDKDKTMLALLGKHLGNQSTYADIKGKIISLVSDSVTHVAKKAA